MRMVGSACCLYAPLEVMGDVFRVGSAPAVLGVDTSSDIVQLANLTGIHAVFVGLAVIALQGAVLVWITRKTCKLGSKMAMREESADRKLRRRILLDIFPERKRYTLR